MPFGKIHRYRRTTISIHYLRQTAIALHPLLAHSLRHLQRTSFKLQPIMEDNPFHAMSIILCDSRFSRV
ncbi:hypothetical protein HanRHA438_Chr17g0828861 [Helianthus annuus]|nr:hypothetical protein HanRHA438_Chr17g0828861 [Helianthus annuus]